MLQNVSQCDTSSLSNSQNQINGPAIRRRFSHGGVHGVHGGGRDDDVHDDSLDDDDVHDVQYDNDRDAAQQQLR